MVSVKRSNGAGGSKESAAYPGGFVLAACDEVCPVWRQLEVRDDIHVRALVVQHLVAIFRIKEGDLAGFVAGEDERWRSKCADDSLAARRVEEGFRFF